ncbi:urease accessory protein UreF [Brevibacterium aurantiacum]|uniref:Urease accessory protein UreF n=1 Tax=Brevibacterium aurantiacum TaxID=273384 RepID=A0A556CCN1_BREAU|nr:urease accessory UreF family protein [Brevibacterium aurantiacum]TSI15056.1 urease accessory protein UreF [Brevibacterium aurantiacum]
MTRSTSRATLLMLGDGRLPSGGYAHSGGLEQAIRQGWVTDVSDLKDFLRGRLHTTGLMNAAFAVSARHIVGDHRSLSEAGDRPADTTVDETAESLAILDAEFCARTPAPALRTTGEWLGTLMLRSMQRIHPHPLLEYLPKGLQQPLVYGAVGRALELGAAETAAVVLHEAVTGPATAAVKLMSIDPFQAHGAILSLGEELDVAAEAAADYELTPARDLPALSSPLSDFAAEMHVKDHVRLFAS